MKIVRLIRHGESAANAGARTMDHASIPLTDKGIEQAKQVAPSFAEAPDLIVLSPFSRAQATAAFTAAKFPAVCVETWPIQEFTYLNPASCVNTTVAERKHRVAEYWDRADPSYTDDGGAESFLQFVSRAQSFLDRLAGQPTGNLVVFSHGQFINAVAWLIERRPLKIDGHSMRNWREYEIANHVKNCCGYELIQEQDGASWSLNPLSDPRLRP